MKIGKLIGKGLCKAVDGVQWLHEKGNEINDKTNKWEQETHDKLLDKLSKKGDDNASSNK